ncbi:MmcQ/YjbR family DNA-binding protein [Enterococcus sp.]|jgi:predicted DNA-binding protein (MmcQ/YjbR family)|uniref:MmcQ/YjbR family DNA-binding protein n=1 Tax=Enterococcus sp. TaxID=35783 RepID=UPI0025BED880|nr:MmcQ/YjbR family DNA-binding protein [Enterococcus sp.]
MNHQIQQRIDRLQSYGQSLAGANVAYREDWGTIYFGLIGKQFGMMSPEATDDAIITLKNKPEVNEELREQYPGTIIPGYYANKAHWNSIRLAADEVTDEQIEQLILTSYELVYQKLTKKQKEEVAALKKM